MLDIVIFIRQKAQSFINQNNAIFHRIYLYIM